MSLRSLAASPSISIESTAITALYESLQNESPEEISSEVWLEKGKREKIQKQFSDAIFSFEKALAKSEQGNNLSGVLESIEHIGDILLSQAKYANAAKVYACYLALLKQEKSHLALHKLKEVEKAYLTSTPWRKEAEGISIEKKRQVEKVQLLKFPPSCQELASQIKNKLLQLCYVGELAKQYHDHAIKKFLALATGVQTLSTIKKFITRATPHQPLSVEEVRKTLQDIQSVISKLETADLLHENNILRHQQSLKLARQTLKVKCDASETASSLTGYITAMLQNLFKEIIWDSFNQLKPPPCKFAILGIGSMARGEMSPYSDVEYAILVESDTPEIRSYFIILARLIELKVIFLGETPYPILQKGNKSPVPEGFRMDIGGNTPLNELIALIAIPTTLAFYQSPSYFESHFITVNALRDSCFLVGSHFLYDAYVTEIKEILNQPSHITFPASVRQLMEMPEISKGIVEIIYPFTNLVPDSTRSFRYHVKDPKQVTRIEHSVRESHLLKASDSQEVMIQKEQTLTVGQNYGYILGKTAMKEFNPDLASKVLYQRECVVIKRELYRLLSLFGSVLVLYYGIQERNFWMLCHKLVAQGKLSQEISNLLCSIMEDIIRLRFEAQLYYEEEREELYLVANKKDSSEKRLVANPEQLKRIKRIYQLLYPLHSILSLFIKNRVDERLLQTLTAYQAHNFVEEGHRHLAANDLEGAIDSFKKELALESERPQAINWLRMCEYLQNIQIDDQDELNQQVKFYQTDYKELDELLRKGNDFKEINHFLQRVAFLSNLIVQNSPAFFLLPFSLLAAHIDRSIKRKDFLAMHFLHFLIQKLGEKLPKKLEVEWCHQYIDLFFKNIQAFQTLDNIQSPLQKNFQPNHTDYLVIDCLVNRLASILSHTESHYPRVEIFLDCAAYFLKERDCQKARVHLMYSLKKVELTEPAEQTKLKVLIYEALSQLELLEGRKKEARLHMAQAVQFARQAVYSVEIMEKKLADLDLEEVLAGRESAVGREKVAVLPKDNKEMVEQFLSEGSSLLALPYLEKMLKDDPTNEILISQVQALRISKMLHEAVCSQIPPIIETLEEYKDLDHVISCSPPMFLLTPGSQSLLKLITQAPARFAIAYFYGYFLSIQSFCRAQENKKVSQQLIDQPIKQELKKLLSIFGDRLPKPIELEIYLNLACLYSEWDEFLNAEDMLKKALNLHQKHLRHDKRIVNIYIEMGRVYKNTNRLNEAKQYYHRAIEERKAYKQSDTDLLYIYDGLRLIAFIEKDLKQSTLCFVECVRLIKELNRHSQEIMRTFKELAFTLLANNLWDELLTLIEKIKFYFPDPQDIENDILDLIKEVYHCQEVLLPHQISRFANICAIKGSQIKITGTIYFLLAGLLLNSKKYSESIQLIHQAIELGVSEYLFIRRLLLCYCNKSAFEKVIHFGEKWLDKCPQLAHNSEQLQEFLPDQSDIVLLGLCCRLYAKELKNSQEAQIYLDKAEDYLLKALSFPSYEKNAIDFIEQIKEVLDIDDISYLRRFWNQSKSGSIIDPQAISMNIDRHLENYDLTEVLKGISEQVKDVPIFLEASHLSNDQLKIMCDALIANHRLTFVCSSEELKNLLSICQSAGYPITNLKYNKLLKQDTKEIVYSLHFEREKIAM